MFGFGKKEKKPELEFRLVKKVVKKTSDHEEEDVKYKVVFKSGNYIEFTLTDRIVGYERKFNLGDFDAWEFLDKQSKEDYEKKFIVKEYTTYINRAKWFAQEIGGKLSKHGTSYDCFVKDAKEGTVSFLVSQVEGIQTVSAEKTGKILTSIDYILEDL